MKKQKTFKPRSFVARDACTRQWGSGVHKSKKTNLSNSVLDDLNDYSQYYYGTYWDEEQNEYDYDTDENLEYQLYLSIESRFEIDAFDDWSDEDLDNLIQELNDFIPETKDNNNE